MTLIAEKHRLMICNFLPWISAHRSQEALDSNSLLEVMTFEKPLVIVALENPFWF